MIRLIIQIPKSLKAKLDALRATGTTASGLIRHLLQQHFNAPKGQKGLHEESLAQADDEERDAAYDPAPG